MSTVAVMLACRALTRNHRGGVARRLRRAAAGAVCAAAVTLPLVSAAGAQAATTPTYTPLTLVNGWSNYGLWAAATSSSGIVHLRGEIMTSGTNPVAFTLPLVHPADPAERLDLRDRAKAHRDPLPTSPRSHHRRRRWPSN